MQRFDFSAAEFLGSNGSERARKCRQLAAEADGLAANAINPETREAYLDLKRQWNELADEIEELTTAERVRHEPSSFESGR